MTDAITQEFVEYLVNNFYVRTPKGMNVKEITDNVTAFLKENVKYKRLITLVSKLWKKCDDDNIAIIHDRYVDKLGKSPVEQNGAKLFALLTLSGLHLPTHLSHLDMGWEVEVVISDALLIYMLKIIQEEGLKILQNVVLEYQDFEKYH